jgi:hypothetical protein
MVLGLLRGVRSKWHVGVAGIGAVVMVALVVAGGSSLPVEGTSHLSLGTPSALPLAPKAPLFAPVTLSNPDRSTDGSFGTAVAISDKTAAVGAVNSSAVGSPNPGAGRASIFDAKTGRSTGSYTTSSTMTHGGFGSAIAIDGTTLVVGAPDEPVGSTTGAGNVYVIDTSTGAVRTLTSPNPVSGGNFGDAVAISGKTIVVGADGETTGALFQSGLAYTFDARTGALLATLTSPNAQNSGGFGHSVAISGTTAAVGAIGETAAGSIGAGHVYLFDAKKGTLLATLQSPNAQSMGWFGYSVAVSGTDVAVGAPDETASGDSDAGHAYVFTTSGMPVATLASPNPQTDGVFGQVAISGSIAVVGAPGETAAGVSGSGDAYVFLASTGALVETLTSPNSQSSGAFGDAVAMSGSHAVIGADEETSRGSSAAGNAYVFAVTALTLTSPNAQTDGFFGSSVALSGTAALVGADNEASGGNAGAGNAYTFDSFDGTSLATYSSPNAQIDGTFGESVGISGTTAIIGASYETASGDSLAGHAYLVDTTTSAVTTLTSPNVQTDGGFGRSVAVSGDTAVVGAWAETASGLANAGHAYLVNLTTLAVTTLTSPNPQSSGFFGFSVAVNGSTVAVAATGQSTKIANVSHEGSVYIFNASTGALKRTITDPVGTTDPEFGYSVGLSGTTLVVGAPDATVAGNYAAGEAFVFDAKTGHKITTLTSPNSQSSGQFGISVAISGSTTVVGAYAESSAGDSYAGNAYVFGALTGTLIAGLSSPNVQVDGNFGWSVAISGDSILVGAPYETSGGFGEAGNAYLY